MREQKFAERDQLRLLGPAQIVLFILGEHRDQKDRHRHTPENMDGPVATAFAAALASDTDLAQATAQGNTGLRIGGNIIHQCGALIIGHDRLGPSQKLGQLNHGLQIGHRCVLYANDAWVNGIYVHWRRQE